MEFLKKTRGYTLIELIVAVGIFATLLLLSGASAINFYTTQKREKLRNVVNEESHFLLERLSGMVRENSIDYSEYFDNGCGNHDNIDSATYCNTGEIPTKYGDDFQAYLAHFYYMPSCNSGERDGNGRCDYSDPNNFNEGYFDTGADNVLGDNDKKSFSALRAPAGSPDSSGHQQWELYLLSEDGKTKTILKRMNNGVDDDLDGVTDEDGATTDFSVDNDGDTFVDEDGDELLGMLQLSLSDEVGADGLLDTFIPKEEYRDGTGNLRFVPISPQSLRIVDLRFYIAPLDDPRKAFAESSASSRVQPHVTIVLTAEPSEEALRGIVGEAKDMRISLQTTVSSRIFSNILFPES